MSGCYDRWWFACFQLISIGPLTCQLITCGAKQLTNKLARSKLVACRVTRHKLSLLVGADVWQFVSLIRFCYWLLLFCVCTSLCEKFVFV